MDVKKLIQTIEKSDEYGDYKKENPKSFLAHIFFNFFEEKVVLQAGYYNAEKEKMTTFVEERDNVKKGEEEDVFKVPGADIIELDMKKLKIEPKKAMKLIDEFIKENYKNEIEQKKFVILQTVPKVGTVYNVTILSTTLNAVNIKLSAETGKVVKHHLSGIMDFRKKE